MRTHLKKSVKTSRPKRQLLFLLLVSAVLVSAAMAARYQASRQEIQRASAPIESTVPSAGTARSKTNAEPLQQTAGQPEAPAATEQVLAADPAASEPQAQQHVQCRLNMRKLSEEFKEKTNKEADSLQHRLHYPVVGSNISSEYIREYNDSIAKLYDHYSRKFAEHGCSFPLPPPAPLENDHHL